MTEPKKFVLDLSMHVQLTEEQIWPNDDAPENPTAADVVEVLRESSANLLTALEDWNLEEFVELSVTTVTKEPDKAIW